MKMFRKNSRLIAFIAILAMLFGALAPAISHAMASAQGKTSILMEICSANGNKSLLATELDIEKPADSTDSKTAPMQHCFYCVSHGGSFALLSDIPPLVIHPDLSYSLPALFYHAPHPLFAWAASNPRAPPIAS